MIPTNEEFVRRTNVAHFVCKALRGVHHLPGVTSEDVWLSSQLEMTLALRHLRNDRSTRDLNNSCLREHTRDVLMLLCAVYRCTSASVLVIPEGTYGGTNSLFPHTHTGVFFHGWEDRSKDFSSMDRVAKYASEVLGIVYGNGNGAPSLYLRGMRDPTATLMYASKGYASSEHIPEESYHLLTAKLEHIAHHQYRRTPGEGHLSKSNFCVYQDRKLATAAASFIQYLELRDESLLRDCVQHLYDLELASRRNLARKRPKVKKERRPPAPKDTLDIACAITRTNLKEKDIKPVIRAMRKTGSSEKEITARVRKASAVHGITKRKRRKVDPTRYAGYQKYLQQFRRQRLVRLRRLASVDIPHYQPYFSG